MKTYANFVLLDYLVNRTARKRRPDLIEALLIETSFSLKNCIFFKCFDIEDGFSPFNILLVFEIFFSKPSYTSLENN